MSGAPLRLNCRISSALDHAIRRRCQQTGESVEHLVRAALADYLQVDHGTLFQVSTAGALVEGLYRGEVTVGELRKHGDFGIGTFAGLDGELVALEGRFYQVSGTGSVCEVEDSIRCPYAVVTETPCGSPVSLQACDTLVQLGARLDQLRDSENVFYAVRVEGEFSAVHTRAINPVAEGVPLAEAAAAQREFELQSVRGTLVGFWSPGYLKSILVAGYHLHFLSEDRRSGGHLLGCAGRGLRAWVKRETDFRISLPESTSFLQADLTRDPSAVLDKADKSA